MRRRSVVFFVLLCLSSLTFIAAKRRSVGIGSSETLPELRPERSFAITDESVLAPFTFRRVLETLLAHSEDHTLTAEALFRQWMDTQNAKPGEDQSEIVDGQRRFAISPALREVFILQRMTILREFLLHGTPPPVHAN